MDRNIVITNATIVTPTGKQAVKGEDMNNLSIVKDAVIVVNDGIIVYADEATRLPEEFNLSGYSVIDANGHVVLPGFVDSHTHLIFGGYRPDEFAMRMRGATYMEIMESGGGIQSTVNATRAASSEELLDKARWFINRMVEMGVTTVEVKTGYGLSTESELKMLDVINKLDSDPDKKISIAKTLLCAHAIPSEYKGKTGKYIDLMINEMLPKAKHSAEFCDIFTEKNVFEIEDSRRFLTAAKNMGYKLKLHADEIVTYG